MIIVAWTLALVLWTVAAIHVYWGLGGLWPAHTAAALARTVVGARGIERMPPLSACLAVAGALFATGTWPLFATAVLPAIWPPWLFGTAGVAVAAVFLVRGLAPYTSFWQRRTPEQPFAALDRQLYGPLCLSIGSGVTFLLLKGVL